MHERAALHTGEHLRVDFFRELFLAENDAAARAAQGFVCGRCHKIRVRHRTRMHACGDEAGDVRHIDEKISADLAGKLAHAFEVDLARIGRGTDGDQRGLELTRGFFELLVIDPLVFGRNTVVGHIVKTAGEICLVTVREMAAVREVHREDLIAGFEHREIDCSVGLRA